MNKQELLEGTKIEFPEDEVLVLNGIWEELAYENKEQFYELIKLWDKQSVLSDQIYKFERKDEQRREDRRAELKRCNEIERIAKEILYDGANREWAVALVGEEKAVKIKLENDYELDEEDRKFLLKKF